MTKKVAIYTRVSTASQNAERQELELRSVGARAGWEIVKVYTDHAVSGSKARTHRPAMKALCDDAARRRFDLVAAWSVDRLGRSVQDLIEFLTDLNALRVDLYVHAQAIDTSSPAGRAHFQMLGVFAEFERGLIRERILSGLERAKAKGKVLGRPSLPEDTVDAVRAALIEGKRSLREIAAHCGVGLGTVQRVKHRIEVAA